MKYDGNGLVCVWRWDVCDLGCAWRMMRMTQDVWDCGVDAYDVRGGLNYEKVCIGTDMTYDGDGVCCVFIMMCMN